MSHRGSLLKGIDNIRYMGGGTNTADAINTMRTQMFSQGMGARPGVPRVAIVVTDGRSTSVADTVSGFVTLLRSVEVDIVADVMMLLDFYSVSSDVYMCSVQIDRWPVPDFPLYNVSCSLLTFAEASEFRV